MFREYNKIVEAGASGEAVGLRYLPTTDPGVNTKIDALWMAAYSGKDRGICLLIDDLRPVLENDKDLAYQTLLYAAGGGNAPCVELLLPFSTTAGNTMALKQAAKHGHVECVRILIPVSTPTFNNSEALRHAAKRGHNRCVEALYGVSDPFEALQQLRTRHQDKQSKWEHLSQLCQRDILLQAINNLDPCNEGRRKI